MRVFLIPTRANLTGQSYLAYRFFDTVSDKVVVYQDRSVRKTLISLFRIVLYRKKVDLIYCTMSRSVMGAFRDYLVCLFFTNAQLVLHIHGRGFIECNMFFRKALSKSTQIIVLSEDIAREIRSMFSDLIKDKVHILGNPASVELYPSYSISDRLRFLYYSNIMISKGWLDYIYFSEKFSTYSFAAAGRNIEKTIIPRSVDYLGLVEDQMKQKLFTSTDVVLWLSQYREESFPVSLIEALLSGKTVLGLRHNGVEALFNYPSFYWFHSIEALESYLEDENRLRQIIEKSQHWYSNNHELLLERYSEEKWLYELNKICNIH